MSQGPKTFAVWRVSEMDRATTYERAWKEAERAIREEGRDRVYLVEIQRVFDRTTKVQIRNFKGEGD